jgi:Flp pilus assembly protein TadD
MVARAAMRALDPRPRERSVLLNGIHFISGLPRSGSTLLAAILRQNPRFHAGMTSPVGRLYMALEAALAGRDDGAVPLTEAQCRAILKGLFSNAYDAINAEKVVFDTNRAWTTRLPALTRLFPDARVICCVRSVSWIMDSIERLVRSDVFEMSGTFGLDPGGTVFTRVDRLAARDGIVGYALDALKEAFYGEQAGRLALIEYETLCRAPEQTMRDLYAQIGEPYFPHDFESVDYAAEGFDPAPGARGRHNGRRRVEWIGRSTVLPPELFARFENAAFWRRSDADAGVWQMIPGAVADGGVPQRHGPGGGPVTDAPKPALQELFAVALQDHQAGRLAEAERQYRQILAALPQHSDTLHLLGVVAHQSGRGEVAVQMIGRAIAINATDAVYHSNLGATLFALGRLEEAVACYHRALELKPDYAEACRNMGTALKGLERLEEAAACFRAALEIKPDYAEALNDLGYVLTQLGRLDEANVCLHRAVELSPDYAEAHNNLGSTLRQQGRLDEAIVSFRRSVALKPDYPEAHNNLGGALKQQGRLDEAIACYRRAIEIRPDFPDPHNNLGNAFAAQEQSDEAMACYRHAIELKRDFPNPHNNMGSVFALRQQSQDAVACYRHAIKLKPDYPDAHNNLGMILLRRGDMEAGWPEYEWRWRTPQLVKARRNFPQPQWRGEPAAGRTLLIHAEQGFGDTLQFCRYASLVAARGLRLILEAQKPLVRLLGSLAGPDLVVARGEAIPAFDLHCAMLSLPLAMGTTVASIPAAVPYLSADAAQVAQWRTRLAATQDRRRRIGIAWAGNPRRHAPDIAAVDRRRSIAPELLAPLFDLPDLRFFSLQKDGPKAPAHFPLTDVMAEMDDFADTAALIANLDLVISVDTAVVHLAAALGKPVWVLDRFDSCWRWLTGRRDSPWYPALRLYRQPQAGDWEAVVAEVFRDLRGFGGAPTTLDDARRQALATAAGPGSPPAVRA